MDGDRGTVVPLKKRGRKRAAAQSRTRFSRLWGPEVERAGYTQIPNPLIERQAALGLDAVDLNILIQIIRYWWEPGRYPWPSKQTLAEYVGRHPRTVQRRLTAMERDGLLRREWVPGKRTPVYKLAGLIKAVRQLSREALREREEAKERERARAVRRRPRG